MQQPTFCSVCFAYARPSSLYCVLDLFLYLCVGSAKLHCGATPPSVMVIIFLVVKGWEKLRKIDRIGWRIKCRIVCQIECSIRSQIGCCTHFSDRFCADILTPSLTIRTSIFRQRCCDCRVNCDRQVFSIAPPLNIHNGYYARNTGGSQVHLPPLLQKYFSKTSKSFLGHFFLATL